jgi:hypothetical protein
MNNRIIILLLTFFLLAESTTSFARPRRSKSCVRKVLLPGHSKPVKCSKARKIKNAYF